MLRHRGRRRDRHRSIHLLVDNPLLDFTPPDIQIPYCDPAGTTVAMPVTNTGDGPATNVRLEVDFPASLQIQNVQGGASWDGTYFHLPDLAAGGSFDLTFDVVYTGDWCAGGPSGSLYWQAIYDNVCGDEFRPPAKFGSYGTDYGADGPPTVSVSLTGPDQVYICSEHTYSLAAGFSGLDSCGGGTTSDITVTVNVPQGFAVTDPGSGTWTPGGDGTGGRSTGVVSTRLPASTRRSPCTHREARNAVKSPISPPPPRRPTAADVRFRPPTPFPSRSSATSSSPPPATHRPQPRKNAGRSPTPIPTSSPTTLPSMRSASTSSRSPSPRQTTKITWKDRSRSPSMVLQQTR